MSDTASLSLGASEAPKPGFASAIAAARELLREVAVRTPVVRSAGIDALAGAEVLIKNEAAQRTGSFKFRGAYVAIWRLDQRPPGGVVAYSSGNHGLGVAHAARLQGLSALVICPSDAPASKIAAIRASGAQVVSYDRLRDDREAIAADLAHSRNAVVIPSADHADVIAGQATATAELISQIQPRSLARLLVPTGGGGLVAGAALAVAALSPSTEVYAVEPEGFDDFGRSLRLGQPYRLPALPQASICDGLMAPTPAQLPFRIAAAHGVKALQVTDEEVRRAVNMAHVQLNLRIEPSGAAALAAALGRTAPRGGITGVIISGGNVDEDVFQACLTGERPGGRS